jgi:hypothetical protein
MEMCIDSADDVPLSEQPIKTPAQTISAGHFIVNQNPFKAMGQNIKFGQPKKCRVVLVPGVKRNLADFILP